MTNRFDGLGIVFAAIAIPYSESKVATGAFGAGGGDPPQAKSVELSKMIKFNLNVIPYTNSLYDSDTNLRHI